MSEINLVLVVIGGLVLLLGLVSGTLKRKGLPAPLIALLLGVVLGPVTGLLDPARWGEEHHILEEAARLTLAVGLMGVALRFPAGTLARNKGNLVLLLALGMPAMWLVSSGLVGWLLGLSLWPALLVGAVITPTDPIVASSIVTGSVAKESLPDRLRQTLSMESGINDGLAYPFVLLPILMLTRPSDEALTHFATRVLLWEVGGAVLLGVVIGWLAGAALKWTEHHGLTEKKSTLAYALALALLTLGAVRLMGSDGILAVFAAGVIFDHKLDASERAEDEHVIEGIDMFFTLPIFALLGLAIPWQGWLDLGWAGLALVLAVLLLRRLPAVLAVKPLSAGLPRLADALFLGWFGPIGVAALFYANLAHKKTGVQEVWEVGSLVVCASIVVHGLTATPLTRLYARATPEEDPSEGEESGQQQGEEQEDEGQR